MMFSTFVSYTVLRMQSFCTTDYKRIMHCCILKICITMLYRVPVCTDELPKNSNEIQKNVRALKSTKIF